MSLNHATYFEQKLGKQSGDVTVEKSASYQAPLQTPDYQAKSNLICSTYARVLLDSVPSSSNRACGEQVGKSTFSDTVAPLSSAPHL